MYETTVFAPRDKTGTTGDPNLVATALLTAIEGLPEKAKAVWEACTKREFNLGFACGTAPSAFTSTLSLEVLKRIAEVGASVTVTLYPVGLPERTAPRTRTRRRRTSTRRSDHLR